jgi:hypothetical protein
MVLGNEGRGVLNACVASLSIMVCVPLPAWCYQGMTWCPHACINTFLRRAMPLARGLGTMIAPLLSVRDSLRRGVQALVRRLSGEGRREASARASATAVGLQNRRLSRPLVAHEKVWAHQPPQ